MEDYYQDYIKNLYESIRKWQITKFFLMVKNHDLAFLKKEKKKLV